MKNIDIYVKPILKKNDDFMLPGSQKTPFMRNRVKEEKEKDNQYKLKKAMAIPIGLINVGHKQCTRSSALKAKS